MQDITIDNCHVLVFAQDNTPTILTNRTILINGTTITSITPALQTKSPPSHTTIDGNGLLAIPGLINCHAHVPMVLFRGLVEDVSVNRWFNEFIWPVESNLNEEDVYWGMLLGLVEMIEAGVTTVADHYFFMDQAGRAVTEAGTRAALGWAVFASQGYGALDNTAAFAERWQGAAEGRISTWLAPHAPYTCDDEFLRAAVDRARRLKTGIHIHAAEDPQQTRASLEKRGITPIQVLQQTGILELPTLIAHGCGITAPDIELLAKYADHVGVAHCPKTYLKLAAGLTPIRGLRAAGVAIGLGTDGAASNNTLDILEQMRLMALMQKWTADDPEVMPVSEALAIAWRGGAATVGLADRIGQIAPGYLADIALLDLQGAHMQPWHNLSANLVYSSRASDVQTVIVNGKVIMQDRKILTLDKAEIIQQVNQRLERLAQRLPEKRIQVYQP